MASGNSPHRTTNVWKVLHGAPPTPPAPRRDPDRNPQPNAGQQQKAAAAAEGMGSPGMPMPAASSPSQAAGLGRHHHTLNSSLDTLQLPPGSMLRSSLDDIMQLQRQQQQQLLQQQHGAKQAWGANAPSGKLLPPLDSTSQVKRIITASGCSLNLMCCTQQWLLRSCSAPCFCHWQYGLGSLAAKTCGLYLQNNSLML